MDKIEVKNIDQYISNYSGLINEVLQNVRNVIKENAPNAEEIISYGMPTFYLHGNLIHFAANKKHLGIYPAPSAITHFKEQFGEFKYSKGAVQFPFDKEIPYQLIAEMTKFRVAENIAKFESKQKK